MIQLMPPQVGDRFLRPKEVEALFGISVSLLKKWRWRGTGCEYIRRNRMIFYKESTFRHWLDQATYRNTSEYRDSQGDGQ